MSSLALTLYHRPGCHLCDDMHVALQTLLEGSETVIDLVNIDKDPDLCARYGSDIPVLVAGEREICRHRLDPALIEQLLKT